MLIPITDDAFGIADRIKSIDSGYFVVYNTKKLRYEVHSLNNTGTDTFCIALPYKSLDCRAVHLVRKTRIERIKEVLEEMERENRQAGFSDGYRPNS